ncbi:hypothetical protein AaE_002138 [Aphanomyces astaci]|uniref:Major facilitator superfamily (MFS) profile domain-containing protein n=1 Tax=Aphanomyces astaci TaxID=112090 RepID=A0A6A5AX63_APHAT|nr:hypothetical protein AaE_002138 [Aphanomyces astaci]
MTTDVNDYQIAAGNIESVRQELNMTATDMGWIISSGSWAYALTAPLTGQWTDRMGGHTGMLVACVGAGVCNLILGCLFATKSSSQLPFMLLFASNVALQGFGTSAVVKINAMWYAPSERGIFSGTVHSPLLSLSLLYFSIALPSSCIVRALGLGITKWACIYS